LAAEIHCADSHAEESNASVRTPTSVAALDAHPTPKATTIAAAMAVKRESFLIIIVLFN
jgi:hypothetical protein